MSLKQDASDEVDSMAQALSDLADGRATPAQARALAAAWPHQAELRRDWQTFHLIGDSLRSAELAQQAQSGEALLAGLRSRLAAEPSPARVVRWHDWTRPLAVAASFVALALAVPSLQGLLRPEAALLASQPGMSSHQPALGSALVGASPSFAAQTAAAPPVAGNVLLRDAAPDASVAPLDIAVPASAGASASASVTSALPRR